MTVVLFICAANLYRSPLAASLLRGELARRGASATITSAGLRAGGEIPSAGLAEHMEEWGLDPSEQRGHRVRLEDLRAADLVVTMEHHQVAEVALLEPDVWRRTFTLKEIVARAERIPPRAAAEPFDDWLARVRAGRTRMDIVGAWHYDVADPVGGSAAALGQTADVLEDLVARLCDAGWPPPPRGGSHRQAADTRARRASKTPPS